MNLLLSPRRVLLWLQYYYYAPPHAKTHSPATDTIIIIISIIITTAAKLNLFFLHIIHLSCWRQLYSRAVENRCQRWSCFLLLLLIPRNIIFGHNSFSHTHSINATFCTFVKFFSSVSIKIIFFAIFCSHTLRHTIFNVVFVTTLPAQFIPIYSWRHYSLLHTVDNDLQFPEGEPATTPYFVCTWILWGFRIRALFDRPCTWAAEYSLCMLIYNWCCVLHVIQVSAGVAALRTLAASCRITFNIFHTQNRRVSDSPALLYVTHRPFNRHTIRLRWYCILDDTHAVGLR